MMLKKLYDKSRIWFAVGWIAAYCVLMSVGDSLSAMVGIEKAVTLPIGMLLTAVLLLFLWKNNLFSAYGLCRAKATSRLMLYYLPVLIMLSMNLWYGIHVNYGVPETLLYILSMFCVGFLEEVIFRGLLFNAMRRDNLTSAVIVSSVTFGIGHIINLVNGSGAELLPNLLQVVYAAAAGFMFVMIYLRTDSLVICIAAHGVFNALSVFANEAAMMPGDRILSCVLLTALTGTYAVYLAVSGKKAC
jgi:membrane protease YdiL (CAAX protease family)